MNEAVPRAVQDCHDLLRWLIPHLDKLPHRRPARPLRRGRREADRLPPPVRAHTENHYAEQLYRYRNAIDE